MICIFWNFNSYLLVFCGNLLFFRKNCRNHKNNLLINPKKQICRKKRRKSVKSQYVQTIVSERKKTYN